MLGRSLKITSILLLLGMVAAQKPSLLALT